MGGTHPEQFRDDPLVIAIGSRTLRCQALTFFLVPLTILTNMCLQTTRKTAGAMLVAAGRSGLFLIPTLLVLPRALGITAWNGVRAFPILRLPPGSCADPEVFQKLPEGEE